MAKPESQQPPDGLESAGAPAHPSESAERPEWLVGADEGLTAEQASEWEAPPSTRRPVLTRIDSPRESAAAAVPEIPKAWAAAAPSVPKLSIVPQRTRPERIDELDDDDNDHSAPEESLDRAEIKEVAPPPIRLHHEPLWLVWAEVLATNRLLQVAIASVIIALVTLAYWPRQDGRGVPLGEIRRHPEQFEGRNVQVQGKVGEVFDMSSGFVFHLIQGRDTVVVFSPDRRPNPHDQVRVSGSVSTGFLDGVARVAIFETPSAPSTP